MQQPDPDSFLISAESLQQQLGDSQLLPVFVGGSESFRAGHIPGSAQVQPAALVCGEAPAAGKIADADNLAHVFSSIGLQASDTVVAYDDEGGGWAGRLIWTLDVIGHSNYRLLDGGILAWRAAGLPVSSHSEARPASDYAVHIDKEQLVSAESIIESLGDENFAIWDARSAAEHRGERALAARAGRIPGARNVDWLELMDRHNNLQLKPLEQIAALLQERGLNSAQRIVTHCQSHHRSGLSYVVGKLLGLDIRAYDGSWSEWGNREDTPVESDA